MFCRCFVSRLFVMVALFAATSFAHADGGYRKTLMQWSYGTSFEGGPDVYAPLVTDRPRFTEASATVGYGVWQIESGYTFIYDRNGGETRYTHSVPEVLVRMGMFAEWFELRFEENYSNQLTDFGLFEEEISGATDLIVGAKIALTPQEMILPETAVVLQVSVPTGSSAVTSDEVLPGVNYAYYWDITDKWSTAGSTGVNAATDDETNGSFSLISQSWTVNYSLTERLGTYSEWYVLVPSGADTESTENYFNGGFTFLFNNDLQWDIRAGVGLNDAADDFFAGSGISFRYW